MRISILTYRSDVGAWATVARNLASGLDAKTINVDVLYLTGPQPSSVAGYPSRVRLIRLGRRSRTCWFSVASYLRNTRPDAMISLGWILNPAAVLAVAWSRTGTPLLLNDGSLLSYKTRVEHRGQLALRTLGVVARLLYPRADAVTGASGDIVRDLEVRIGVDAQRVRMRVIPNAVDLDAVVELSQRPHDVLAGSWPVFVTVARHAQQKNLPLLLRAFARYLAGGATGMLVLVGHGPDTEELQRLAHELGISQDVHFTGFLTNPFPQVAAATAFVLSSEEEGFGLVLVEAMALGVPVISTDCPGGPRDILLDGRAGLLVPSADEAALSDAMGRVAKDAELRALLIAVGQRRAQDFSPTSVAQLWLDLIRELLSGSDTVSGGSPCQR